MLEIKFGPFPEIRTPRLWLREKVEADAEDLLHLRTHPQVTKYLDRENDKDVSVVTALIRSIKESFDNGNGISWGISLSDDPRIIGDISIWRIDKKNHRGEVGYSILPEFWKNGFMSEAMTEILRFAFEEIRLHSLEANTSVDNAASHALLRKFGFVQEAHFKENWEYRGQFYDSVIFSLLARNWRETR